MTQTAADTRPPGLAAWLVELFASPEQAESILGDLSPRISGHRFGIRNRFCPPLALAPKPLNYGIPIVHIIASMFPPGIIALVAKGRER